MSRIGGPVNRVWPATGLPQRFKDNVFGEMQYIISKELASGGALCEK